MEEILASIRRIIADEQAASATVQPIRPDVQVRPPVAPESAPAASQAVQEFDAWLARTDNGRIDFSANLTASGGAAPAPVQDHPVEQSAPGYELRGSHIEVDAEPASYEPQAVSYQHEQRAWDMPASSPRLTVVQPEPEHYEPAAANEGSATAPDDLDQPLQPAGDAEGLLSAVARQSVQSSFQALARTMFMQNTGVVEEAMRDMLRPMLKQWLDDNLPAVVERLVRAEIERVARGGR